jgi:atypical dual specificity phosphatase
MSRSVTVTVAYIMSVTNLNWKEALKVVRAGRAVANPNLGFQKQLQDFEATRLVKVIHKTSDFIIHFLATICS